MKVGLHCVIVAFPGQIFSRFDVYDAITIISHLGLVILFQPSFKICSDQLSNHL